MVGEGEPVALRLVLMPLAATISAASQAIDPRRSAMVAKYFERQPVDPSRPPLTHWRY